MENLHRPRLHEIPSFVRYLTHPDIITSGNEIRHIRNNAKRDSFNESFSLLVWNIHKGKKQEVFGEANEMDADLILLQEYVDFPHIGQSAFFDDKEASMAVSFYCRPDKQLPSGVCTASQVKSQDTQAFKTKHREVMLTPKTALFTTYPIAGSDEQLGVLNIHGINFVRSSRFQYFLDELDDHAKSHVGPFIFAGDFNTWSKGREEIVDVIMEKHGLEQVLLPGATEKFGLALDRVYIRGLHTELAKVISSTASDHNPLLLKLAFK